MVKFHVLTPIPAWEFIMTASICVNMVFTIPAIKTTSPAFAGLVVF